MTRLGVRVQTVRDKDWSPQQQNFAMGPLAQVSSGAIRCSFNTRFQTRFRRVPVQIPRGVPEGSSEDTCWGSGGFSAVPERSGADTVRGSGGFRWRYDCFFLTQHPYRYICIDTVICLQFSHLWWCHLCTSPIEKWHSDGRPQALTVGKQSW